MRAIALALLLAAGCDSSSGEPDAGGAEPDAPSATVRFVTVGVFTQEADGSFTDTGRDLVYEVGVVCQTWDRMAAGDATNPDPHLHYNAADETSYVDETFRWTEYGPEHSLADAEATCADGADGVVKSVDWTDHYEDHPGVFLRITGVE